MDTLVLDIETKQTFGDLGGREFFNKMEMSVCGVYSYKKNKYYCYGEDEFDKLKAILSEKALLVGFSANKFDFPILKRTLDIDLFRYPRVDISDEIERETGRLISLNALAGANFGTQKLAQGIIAPILYRAGKIKELKEYCTNDVKITKELYDKIKKDGWLLVPASTRESSSTRGGPDRERDLPTQVAIALAPDITTLF